MASVGSCRGAAPRSCRGGSARARAFRPGGERLLPPANAPIQLLCGEVFRQGSSRSRPRNYCRRQLNLRKVTEVRTQILRAASVPFASITRLGLAFRPIHVASGTANETPNARCISCIFILFGALSVRRNEPSAPLVAARSNVDLSN